MKGWLNTLVLFAPPVVISAPLTTFPEEHVNTRLGLESRCGYTRPALPLVGMPFGVHMWTPQTRYFDDPGYWRDEKFFDISDKRIYGMRLTHVCSQWGEDWGEVLFSPHLGQDSLDFGLVTSRAEWRPYEFSADLFGMHSSATGAPGKVKITAGYNKAMMRFEFPPYNPQIPSDQTRHLTVTVFDRPDLSLNPIEIERSYFYFDPDHYNLRLKTEKINESRPVPNFTEFLKILFDTPWTHHKVKMFDDHVSAELNFSPLVNVIEAKISVSLISHAQTVRNMNDILDLSYDNFKMINKMTWRNHLRHLELHDIGNYDVSKTLERVYTALYRVSLAPRTLAEPDSDGTIQYYSPFAEQRTILKGGGAVCFDLPIMMQSQLSVISGIYPLQFAAFYRAWTETFRVAGWFPQVSTLGFQDRKERTTLGDVAIADGFFDISKVEDAEVVGLFDPAAVMQGLIRNSITDSPKSSAVPGAGRAGMFDYTKLGYIPNSQEYSVSSTIAAYFADWAAGEVARSYDHGDPDFVALTQRRWKHFQRIWNKDTKCFHGTTADGQQPNVERHAWTDDFLVGSAVNYRFLLRFLIDHALQDSSNPDLTPSGVCDAIISLLSEFPAGVNKRSDRNTAPYDAPYEFPCLYRDDLGAYSHGNPRLHMTFPMLFDLYALDPDLYETCGIPAGRIISRMVDRLYMGDDPYIGSELFGEQSSWFLSAILGLWSVTVPELSPGAPLFNEIKVIRDDGKEIQIIRKGDCPRCDAPRYVEINGNRFVGRLGTQDLLLLPKNVVAFIFAE